MKILALTDIHGRISYIRYLVKSVGGTDYDLVVVAGDLTYFSEYIEAVNILNTIYRELGRRILFVPGNCDDSRLLDVESISSYILNIHKRVYLYSNKYFYGIGGSNKTPFNTWIEWREEDFERFLVEIMNIDWNKLVLVTHTPIYSIMDNINGVNTGSWKLYEFLNKHGSLLWITGHLHEYSGFTKVGKTVIVNPGPFIKGYYALISIDNDYVEVSIRNFLEES